MIDYYSLPEANLPMSMRCLRKLLKEKGWKAEKLTAEGPNNLILTRPDGKIIKIASSTPPTTSVYALQLADNKMLSYELLKELDIPQPETIVIHDPRQALPMLEKYSRVVIKPIDGAHGRGVTTGIEDIKQVTNALDQAKAASPDLKCAIIQPQLPAKELETRIICIGYQFIEAIARIPAHITGDGVHTIREIMKRENQTTRGPAYQTTLAYINEDAAQRFLGDKLNTIPTDAENVQVVGSCNIGQGGTAEDYSAKIPAKLRQLSVEIAKAAELPVVGIDFYGENVIELNACPSLYYPTGNETATKAVDAYVNYLASL